MKDLATLLLIVALVGLAAVAVAEHRTDPAPIVRAAWPQPKQSAGNCPKLPDPCEAINCYRTEARRIA